MYKVIRLRWDSPDAMSEKLNIKLSGYEIVSSSHDEGELVIIAKAPNAQP